MTPTVWVTNFRGQNIEHANNFGKIKMLTTDRVNVFDVESMIGVMHEQLKDSHPGDYILLTGAPVLSILAAIEMLHQHNRVNLLIWHAALKRYMPRAIEMNVGADATEAMLRAVLIGAEV